jgi:hypothetical protein
MAGIGAASDPRVDNGLNPTSYPNRVLQKLHDTSITLEEYMYYAKLTREEEERLYGPGSSFAATEGPVKAFFKSKVLRKPVQKREVPIPRLSISAQGEGQIETNEKHSTGDGADKERRGSVIVSDEEWVQASRAARTATWSAVFYLITTDILGPFSTGYAFSQMGFGPGVALFTVFGVLSWYSAYQLWRMFLQLDSDRYPMKGYGDVAFRVYGPWFRHVVNVLQSFQFFLNVALIIISSGQSISQMSKGKLCFIVCVVVCAVAGCVIGQIRTLQRFGWLASSAVFMNLLIIFCSMGVIAHSTPNYTAAFASYPGLFPDGTNASDPPPIKISAAAPAGLGLVDNVNGLMNAVFSFGGATLFVELMAEMRRPMDFWKGMICAEILIYICYMVYGCFCYALQGQYVFNPSYQGVSPYGWQTFGNALGLITGVIAAVLYGNIGIKVLYNNVGRDVFHFPILESKKGKWIWTAFVPIYWISAWVIASSVPQITSWIVFVGAACILQFTYTFPPFLMVGFKSQRDAILPEDTFDPNTGVATHVDSGVKRWVRGYKKEFLWNVWDTFFALGAFTTGILGIYSAITLMNDAYHNGSNLTGWSCNSPTG